MRVTSGIYKNKKLIGDNIEGTRPTKDRVKEAIFSIIREDLYNKTFLDLFGGSGALSIEALSNGAKDGYIIDNNQEAINAIKENLKDKNITIIKDDYKSAINTLKEKQIIFDIIFLDPPYKLTNINEILNLLIPLINKETVIVYEYENKEEIKKPFIEIKQKKYGITKISIIKKETEWEKNQNYT